VGSAKDVGGVSLKGHLNWTIACPMHPAPTRPRPTGGHLQLHPLGDPSPLIMGHEAWALPRDRDRVKGTVSSQGRAHAIERTQRRATNLNGPDTAPERPNPTATSARERRPPGSMARAQSAASLPPKSTARSPPDRQAHHLTSEQNAGLSQKAKAAECHSPLTVGRLSPRPIRHTRAVLHTPNSGTM
jgi:hypothetical protein